MNENSVTDNRYILNLRKQLSIELANKDVNILTNLSEKSYS